MPRERLGSGDCEPGAVARGAGTDLARAGVVQHSVAHLDQAPDRRLNAFTLLVVSFAALSGLLFGYDLCIVNGTVRGLTTANCMLPQQPALSWFVPLTGGMCVVPSRAAVHP